MVTLMLKWLDMDLILGTGTRDRLEQSGAQF